MFRTNRIAEFRAWRAAALDRGHRLGLVATMGALHEGHLSHIAALRGETDEIVVSVFVNPLQFAPGEDFARYPRDLARDAQLAERAGATALFAPDAGEMYPREPQTSVRVEPLGSMLEGVARPTHFQGVATVVTKLLNVVGPDVATFGQKDLQQLMIVRRLVEDLNFPVKIWAVPTLRESDGLAMSSRNRYLDVEERRLAPRLYHSLQMGLQCLRGGERRSAAVETAMAAALTDVPPLQLEYATLRALPDLRPTETAEGKLALLVAARLPHARLLDNLVVDVNPTGVRETLP